MFSVFRIYLHELNFSDVTNIGFIVSITKGGCKPIYFIKNHKHTHTDKKKDLQILSTINNILVLSFKLQIKNKILRKFESTCKKEKKKKKKPKNLKNKMDHLFFSLFNINSMHIACAEKISNFKIKSYHFSKENNKKSECKHARCLSEKQITQVNIIANIKKKKKKKTSILLKFLVLFFVVRVE